MNVTPPVLRPFESAGYLGYYTRHHLTLTFDLVDIDGASPVVWLYRKAETCTVRIIEEKPCGQQIHESQSRLLGAMVSVGFDVYVLHHAERLVAPEFPVALERMRDPRTREMGREAFDGWLLDGLDPRMAAPPTPGRVARLADELVDIQWVADAGASAEHVAARLAELMADAQRLHHQLGVTA